MGSTGLSKAQKNYLIKELELLAIQWALDKLKVFTVGEQQIIALTDNSSIVGSWNKNLEETENPRTVRIMEKMSHLNLEIKHVKGVRIAVLISFPAIKWKKQERMQMRLKRTTHTRGWSMEYKPEARHCQCQKT